jgi:hypothetical protein
MLYPSASEVNTTKSGREIAAALGPKEPLT